jgi:hypothetical protein
MSWSILSFHTPDWFSSNPTIIKLFSLDFLSFISSMTVVIASFLDRLALICRKKIEEHIVLDLKIEDRCSQIMKEYEDRITQLETSDREM